MDPEDNKTQKEEKLTTEPTNTTWHATDPDPGHPPLDTTPPAAYSGANMVSGPKKSFGQKLKVLLKSKKFWFSLLGILVLGLIVAWFIQPSRLWIVNALGMKNTLTISTITPGEGSKSKVSQLRNVSITVNGASYKTDDKGKLQVSGVPYGKADVTAKKTGFADVRYGVTLDFDPFFHKFGGQAEDDAMRKVELSLKGVGLPVAFKLVDALSGKSITSGEFTVGDVVAKPDDQGLVSLKIPATDNKTATVSAAFGGAYLDKKFDVEINAKTAPTVSFVPGGKHYFISKRSGVLTVYSSNLDGSDVQPIVTGTGRETGDTAFAVSPDGKYGVLSSARDGTKDAKQNDVQGVYVVDLATKQLTRVDSGSYVNFVEWSGNTLVYTGSAYDTDTNSLRTSLHSVDVTQKRVFNFETSDGVFVATVAGGKVVYQKYINSGPDAVDSPILREAAINGDAQKTLGDKVLMGDSYMQLDFDRIAFRTDQDQAWHEYNLSSDQLKTIAQPFIDNKSQQFLSTTNSDGSKRLVLDRVDGKDTLFIKDVATGSQKVLAAAGGLGGPIRWIGDVVVFRIADGTQTADYAVSINGGEPKKITDVTATGGTQGAAIDRFRLY